MPAPSRLGRDFEARMSVVADNHRKFIFSNIVSLAFYPGRVECFTELACVDQEQLIMYNYDISSIVNSMGFEDAFLKSPKAENSESEKEIARLNVEESALEADSERKKKWRNLFLAISVFAGSFAGNVMAEKNAFAGASENDVNQKKISSDFSYNQEDFIKAMENRDAEVKKEMSPNRPYNQVEFLKAVEGQEKGISSGSPYNQKDFIKFAEGQAAERKQELYQRAVEKIKAELQKEKDYSGIKNPSLRRSAEDNYRRAQLGMKAIIDNPEKVKTKVIDGDTVLLSITYENPDTGLSQVYDHFYQLVEKK